MTLKDYLLSLSKDENQIHLIGPLFSGLSLPKEPTIFVDGGTRFRKDKRGFSVGDGDSSAGDLDELISKEKDFSDLTYVLNHLGHRFNQIYLFGFLGGRKDHELINFAEIHQFLLPQEQKVKVLFDEQVIALSKGAWEIEIHGVFSTFLFEKTQVTLSGNCRYTASDTHSVRYLSSHGLSNEGSGLVKIKTNGPVFLFLSSF